MVGVADAVDRRVAHVDVRRRHVDAGAEHLAAVREFAGAHALEEVQVLLDRALASGRLLAGLGQGAAVFLELVLGELADVGLSHFDKLKCVFVHLVEIVGRVEETVLPVGAEPLHVFEDGLDVLGVFLHGIRVVEAEVELAAELLRGAEVQADALRMADVEVAVRLRRETRLDRAAVLAGFEVLADDLVDEVVGEIDLGFAHIVSLRIWNSVRKRITK